MDDHNVIAKQEHVEAIEAELDRMKKMATHVYEEMVFMRDRADAMHTTAESTRARLLWVEIVMMCTLLFMGLWQARTAEGRPLRIPLPRAPRRKPRRIVDTGPPPRRYTISNATSRPRRSYRGEAGSVRPKSCRAARAKVEYLWCL